MKLGTFNDTDLAADFASLDLAALQHGVILNDARAEAEQALADFVNAGNPGQQVQAVMTKSGTQALTLALKAVGVRPGDLVATSPWTFIATCSAITSIGAEPVFVDIDPKRWTMDPAKLKHALDVVYGHNVKAIVPVDLFGVPADLAAIAEVADCTPVVVDACQSLGAMVNGVHVGALPGATATVVSLYPTKPVGGHGEGGAVLTANEKLAVTVRQLADHGAVVDNNGVKQCATPGVNGRPDALLAALFVAKLKRAKANLAKRRQLLMVYNEMLAGKAMLQQVPADVEPAVHVVQTVVADRRLGDALRQRLAVNTLYTRTVTDNPFYAKHKCSVASTLARTSIGLPAYPDIEAETLRQTLQEIVNGQG